jgi:DNA invertase Pin-like site-specific DNA recombinase
MDTNSQTLRVSKGQIMTTYAYLRVSVDSQDTGNQKLAILEYAQRNNIMVDKFIPITISSRKTRKQRRIDELMDRLQPGDMLIVSEMSRLGRSVPEVTTLISQLIEKKIRIICIKENLDLLDGHNMQTKVTVTLFSLLAELERDLISLRTKEALAAKKKKGIKLGKPKGTIQASKFDKDRQKIEELLGYGVSVRKIAEFLGYGSHRGLNLYINKRIKKT